MTNLSLQDRFSLISLNALNSTRNSTAKKAAIRCISAAGVLDRFLQETEELTEDSDEYRSRLDALSVSLKEAAHLSSSAAKELEHTVYTRLNNLGLMTEASSLVSCDLEFSSAGNKILEYRTDSDEYSRQTESLRAELMEEGNVFDETVCMLWLLRESSCFYDLFSREEQKYLTSRINELYLNSLLAKTLLSVSIHNALFPPSSVPGFYFRFRLWNVPVPFSLSLKNYIVMPKSVWKASLPDWKKTEMKSM